MTTACHRPQVLEFTFVRADSPSTEVVVPSAPFTIFNLVGDKSVTVTSPTSGYTARLNGVTNVVQSGDTFSSDGSSSGGWLSAYGEPPTSSGLRAWKP